MSRQKAKPAVRTTAEFKSKHAPDPEIRFLREKVTELERKLTSERVLTGEAVEIISAVRDSIQVAEPTPIVYSAKKNKGTSPVTHVLHLTDWHYGALVVKDEVDGFGEFSRKVARARVEALTDAIIHKTEIQRNGYKIPTLHIIGTADFISGDIHHELIATNECPAPVQAVECGYLLGGMLTAFSPHFEKIVVDLVTLDNHGRITKRTQAAQGGENNWSYVVAHIAKQHAIRLDNVEVNVHAKPSALITIGPERYLAFHGHQIKGWAGKPYYGFDRRVAMEAVKRMNIPEQGFSKLVFGHFHHAFNGDSWIMGGSLSGTDAFDHSCGRHSNPHQTSWLVHPKHGEFDWTRWWL
jgi:hypothetical protein